MENKERERMSSLHETAGMGAETYVKCSWVLTRKEKSKETVLLLSNLLPIESKKMKEPIKAFLKNFHRTKLLLYFSLCSHLIFNFSNFEKTFAIFGKVYVSRK